MKYVMMGTSSNFGNMFSMAGATLFLPFLPMLPVQILLNNLLYDLSEMPIPTGPRRRRRGRPRRALGHARSSATSCWMVGPVSSVFDFLTFYVLLACCDAGEALFQTGWFVESLATQVLVIFVIRTRGHPCRERCRARGSRRPRSRSSRPRRVAVDAARGHARVRAAVGAVYAIVAR